MIYPKAFLMFHIRCACTSATGVFRWRAILWIGLCLLATPLWAEITAPVYRGAEERRMGRGASTRIAIAPDDRYLAAPQQGVIRIYDMWDASLVRELGDASHQARGVVYSRADGSLFSIGGDMTLRHWDPSTGQELNRVTLTQYPAELAINTSGTLLLVAEGFTSGKLRLWDAPTLTPLRTLSTSYQSTLGWCPSIGFSPTSSHVFYSYNYGYYYTVDLVNGTEQEHSEPTYNYQYSLLTTGTLALWDCAVYQNGADKVWEPTDGLFSLQDHSFETMRSSFLQERQQILITGWSNLYDPQSHSVKQLKLIGLYNYPNTKASIVLRLPTQNAIIKAECSQSGQFLYVYADDGTLFTYDLVTQSLIRNQHYADADYYNGIAWTHDGQRIVTLGSLGWLTVYQATTGKIEWAGSVARAYAENRPGGAEFTNFAMNADDILFIGTGYGVLWRFNLRTLESPSAHLFNDGIFGIALSPSGTKAALVQQDRTLIIDAESMAVIDNHAPSLGRVQFLDDNRMLLYGSDRLYEVDVTSGTVLRSGSGPGNYWGPSILSRDKSKLFVSTSRYLERYSVAGDPFSLDYHFNNYDSSGQPQQETVDIDSMAILPDSDDLLVGGYSSSLPCEILPFPLMYRMNGEGKILRQYYVENAAPAGVLAVSPDGTRAAAASAMGVDIIRIDPPLAAGDWSQYE